MGTSSAVDLARPVLCEAEEPHALDWLTDDFAYCPGCDLLYVRQPGALVWAADVWINRLAAQLMRMRLHRDLLKSGIDENELDALNAAAITEQGG